MLNFKDFKAFVFKRMINPFSSCIEVIDGKAEQRSRCGCGPCTPIIYPDSSGELVAWALSRTSFTVGTPLGVLHHVAEKVMGICDHVHDRCADTD